MQLEKVVCGRGGPRRRGPPRRLGPGSSRGVGSRRSSRLPARRTPMPPPTAPAASQGLTSSKHTGELAPRGEGGPGNLTLRAAQRSENLWKSDHALGVRSQGHRSPTGTRNR
ncbi:uncharacterized protein [Physeter macrocephalus]|uniref:Uncharacterized protein n=1 Tax=Physeter macrocephalus TaxID=9755 RepID=A0A2Y9S7W5_PHYMC|nr:uncharacterized protein LOC112062356 [Physeter catodon]|eukprot:XP_023972315.1 uncharacterized protein LOC112062356 [Physeter catodon]